MTTLSDFQRARERFPVNEALMAGNAKAAGAQVNWRDTPIRTDSPTARTLAHQKLNRSRLMDGVGETKAERLHMALDRLLDKQEENPSDSDEPEESSDSEEPEESASDEGELSMQDLHAALDFLIDRGNSRNTQKVAARVRSAADSDVRVSSGVSYGRDADAVYIEKYLPPNKLCSEVVSEHYKTAYNKQLDPMTRGHWSALIFQLMNQPQGARIKDVANKASLSQLISKTLAAV